MAVLAARVRPRRGPHRGSRAHDGPADGNASAPPPLPRLQEGRDTSSQGSESKGTISVIRVN